MIEYPEAVTLARQISTELKGRRIQDGMRGNSPHKFAFYTYTPELYAEILPGKVVGDAEAIDSAIQVSLEPGYALILGHGGERILLHPGEKSVPRKHQLLLHFEDGAYLSVNVQGWGAAQLMTCDEVARHMAEHRAKSAPLSDTFTYDYFTCLFDQLETEDARSVKYFIISKPGIEGVGNGYLQDILFRAKLHPRRRAIDISKKERRVLYKAIRDTLQKAVDGGGRDTEFDLHNQPGNYVRILDSRVVGKPCPTCGTLIEKINFLGGASYFCPHCQV